MDATIIVAIIGLIGVVVTALFNNWDKIFPRKQGDRDQGRDLEKNRLTFGWIVGWVAAWAIAGGVTLVSVDTIIYRGADLALAAIVGPVAGAILGVISLIFVRVRPGGFFSGLVRGAIAGAFVGVIVFVGYAIIRP